MASITTWSRLEPRASQEETALAEGYAARVYDPLWFLARQGQVGEFQGEDGGSPIVARWRGRAAPASRMQLGPVGGGETRDGARFDAGAPLEAQVERRPMRRPSAPDALAGLRFAVDAGQQFLRFLAQQATTGDYAAAFRKAYPVPALTATDRGDLDPETLAFADLVAGRALDGRALRAALGPGEPRVDPGIGVAAGDVAEVERACRQWLAWLARVFFEPDADAGDEAWRHERFEYAFSVAAHVQEGPAGERTLSAERYDDGTLDWYAFDLNPGASLGARQDPAGALVTRTVIPAPVTFHGMPAARFWELEDARIDLGAMQLGASDLAQLLLIETLTGYGNDWFVIPIELDVGTICESRSLVITDTFGVRTLIEPQGPGRTSAEGFSMFAFAAAAAAPDAPPPAPVSNLFWLPPTLAKSLEGPVLEEVSIVRDEMANLAWAIERRLETPLEQGRETASDTVVQAEPAGPPREVPLYRLASPVPAHWVPLIPTPVDAQSAEVRLMRGAVLDFAEGIRRIQPQARLLGVGETAGRLAIPEEEAAREGVVLRRRYQAARWFDGRLFVWAGNRASVGRGEAASGLRFDALEG